MQQSILTKIKLFILRNRQNRIFRKFVQVLCCMVVFVTTYALILPAITMEQDAFCGKEAHEHTEECLQPVPVPVLVCTQESLGIHTHSGSCYNADGAVICGQADYVVHSHSGSCYDAAGQLVCLLPERSSHVHGESCYIPGETQPEILHVHSEACYIQEQGELTCTEEEREGHSHGDQCYGPGDLLECTLTEHHVHDASCYSLPLTCSISTEPHVHSENCYGTGNLQCSTPEYHTHTDSCWDRTLSCNETDETHCHDDGCYTANLRCQIPENHAHSSSCYESILVCGKEAGQAHEHNDSCYGTEPQLQCRMPENHVHDSGCYNRVLNCEVPEDPGHRHEDACYQWNSVLNCGLEEGQPEPTEPPEPVLACTEPEAPVHVHGDSCFELQEKTCQGGEDHQHTDSCYTCGLEAHTHTLICYSDPDADVESPEVWKATFAHVTLTGDWPTDVVAIAETQLGYMESTRNYDVWEDNSIHGYTRYGAWYGAPHGDWCGMFASFCLEYAGVEGMPYNYGVRPWIEDLTKLGLYYTAKETKAQKGNLIFFDWDADGLSDHVGIVAEVQEAQEHTGASVKTIEGNSGNAVRYQHYDPNDPVILGYGLLPGQERVPLPEVKEESYINLDINLGPVFTITGQIIVSEETALNDDHIMMFAVMPRNINSLKDYIISKNGIITFALSDWDNHALPKDENGKFIVETGSRYKLSMNISSPSGIPPGTYSYQLPQGLTIEAGTGVFQMKDKETGDTWDVGTWTVTETGTITLVFNEKANRLTDIVITAVMGATFDQADTYIDFDGTIKVSIKAPQEEEVGTALEKWGQQGSTDKNQDPTKIYWTVKINGGNSSTIPGSLITDEIFQGDGFSSGNHSYTASDMDNGIRIGVTDSNGVWHSWLVDKDAPNLDWDADGWSYWLPETVDCDYCTEPLVLGNDRWEYYIQYTSTPDETDIGGKLGYMNGVHLDNVYIDGWGDFVHSSSFAGIIKDGHFEGGDDPKFVWQVTTSIPGMKDGRDPNYHWFIQDSMFIRGENSSLLGYVENGIVNGRITAIRNGVTTTVPTLANAQSNDQIAWHLSWTGTKEDTDYLREIVFYNRCNCTQDACLYWGDSGCGSKPHGDSPFCLCWTIPEDVQIIFDYETTDVELITEHLNSGDMVENFVELYRKVPDAHGEEHNNRIGSANSALPFPNLLTKELTNEFDGYSAHYRITVNESKTQLTSGTPITIRDEMTDSLEYINGSMVITTTDVNGTKRTLTEGVDYTLTYSQSTNGQQSHVITIVVYNPQPVMYTLDYETILIIPEHPPAGGVHYKNSATVKVWGQDMTDDSTEMVYADFNFIAKTFEVDIEKKSAESGDPLAGAVFGLYREDGSLITSDTTDDDGKIRFITSVIDNIILREHQPFYIQEIASPEGFVLDNTEHWFFFCNKEENCTEYDEIRKAHPNISCIPGDRIHILRLTNSMAGYELPATGGAGKELYTVGGMLLMMAAVILLYNQKKCRKEDIYSS